MLLAVNPNENCDEMYTIDMIEEYKGKSLGELPPHVFAIGTNVMRNLRVFEKPQSIVMRGVTGSGKTENTKNLLKFLSGTAQTSFARVIPDANFLLEAFGNSCTSENENSSRFIKLIQVFLSFFFQFIAHRNQKQCLI